MEATQGHPDLAIGLIDGPVATAHPGFVGSTLLGVPGADGRACHRVPSTACRHGTFVAGILAGSRNSGAPAICPDCPLVIRPIFTEAVSPADGVPSATPEALAAAMVDCMNAKVRIVNLSVALTETSACGGDSALEQALHLAARRGILIVAAAGNQGVLGSTSITRHPWVISVIGCDRRGVPLPDSNLGHSIGRRGLAAPGAGITSLDAGGGTTVAAGTSVATPFVTGALALVWTLCATATAGQLRSALFQVHAGRGRGVVPALLNAEALWRALSVPAVHETRT